MVRKLISSVIIITVIIGALLPSLAFAFNDFTLPSLMDLSKKISLSNFKEKVILLNFWTFKCPYCRFELPVLSEVQKAYPDKVKVVSVLFARYSNLNAVRSWVLNKGLDNITILYDERGDAFNTYGVLAVPHTIIFDQQGRRLIEFRGAVPKEVILSAVRKALSQ